MKEYNYMKDTTIDNRKRRLLDLARTYNRSSWDMVLTMPTRGRAEVGKQCVMATLNPLTDNLDWIPISCSKPFTINTLICVTSLPASVPSVYVDVLYVDASEYAQRELSLDKSATFHSVRSNLEALCLARTQRRGTHFNYTCHQNYNLPDLSQELTASHMSLISQMLCRFDGTQTINYCYDHQIISEDLSPHLSQLYLVNGTVASVTYGCLRRQIMEETTCATVNKMSTHETVATQATRQDMNGVVSMVTSVLQDRGICVGDSNSQNQPCYQITTTEKTYIPVSCHSSQFTCPHGECVSLAVRVDGVTDCVGGSDEVPIPDMCGPTSTTSDCHLCTPPYCSCGHHWFQCHSGRCLPWHQVCDGQPQCLLEEDETFCHRVGEPVSNTTLPINETFICNSTALAIPISQVNDLVVDCPRGEDETWSPAYPVPCEKDDHIPCHFGHPQCFPFYSLCVYDHDSYGHLRNCRDGAHLDRCTNIGCSAMFKCPGSYCVPVHKRCDSVKDCPRGEDEEACRTNDTRTVNPPCPGLYRCSGGGHCIHQYQICDGYPDCSHGDDEHYCSLAPCQSSCVCFLTSMLCSNITEHGQVNVSGYKVLNIKGVLALFPSMANVSSMIVFNLSHNQLSSFSIPVGMVYSSLCVLDVSYNRLTYLRPYTFSSFPRLTQLSVIGNPVPSLSPHTFSGLTYLTSLTLSHMKIISIHSEAFTGLESLQFINLDNNPITKLSLVPFQNVKALTAISISNNSIASIINGSQNIDKIINIIGYTGSLCHLTSILHCNVSTSPDMFRIGPITGGYQALLGIYGFLILFHNILHLAFHLKAKSLNHATLHSLVNFSMDALMGLRVIMLALKDQFFSQYNDYQQASVHHVYCLLCAWFEVSSVLISSAINANHAYNLHGIMKASVLLHKTSFRRASFMLASRCLQIAGLCLIPLLLLSVIGQDYIDLSAGCSLFLSHKDFYYHLAMILVILIHMVVIGQYVVTIAYSVLAWKSFTRSRQELLKIGQQMSGSTFNWWPVQHDTIRSVVCILCHLSMMVLSLTVHAFGAGVGFRVELLLSLITFTVPPLLSAFTRSKLLTSARQL